MLRESPGNSKVPWTATADVVSAYLSRYPWRLSTCAMGLLGPSAVEHTTGVVFRVGTPGRLGWAVSVAFTFLPKIEGYGGGSRPFSSVSPLHHLRFLSFYSFFLSLSFFFLIYFSFFPSVSIFYPVLIFFALYSYHPTFSRRLVLRHRACNVSKFLPRCAGRRSYTC